MRWIWIDRFVAFESGKSATAVKSLSSAEDHFEDHYPGFPVMPATLILAPIGFRTLATSVWSAVSEAFFARAAAPALLIILMSSLPMAYIILHERRADV